MRYSDYQTELKADIQSILDEMGCQPILFVGSGISRRYFGAPNWHDLLAEMGERCPLIDKPYAYYLQTFGNPIAIGEIFAMHYKEWAWGAGRGEFPDVLFSPEQPPQIYLKFKVAEYLAALTPESVEMISADMHEEVAALKKIHPHALITTNYDEFLSLVFPDYAPIIGQQVLRAAQASIGEVFMIHGSVRNPTSLVLTQADYDEFARKQKYLSAKLLTYFAEHPLVFLGYGAGDPNIQSILSDIDEIVAAKGRLIHNIYLVTWVPDLVPGFIPQREELVGVGEGRTVRVKNIVTNDLAWVYKAFAHSGALEKINPKLLRALLARTHQLVRTDIPRNEVEVDFSTLEGILENDDELGKVLGIAPISDPAAINANFPYSATQVAQKLGLGSKWHPVVKAIMKVAAATEVDIRTTDNPYHIAVRAGEKMIHHKYSDRAVELIRRVLDGEQIQTEDLKL